MVLQLYLENAKRKKMANNWSEVNSGSDFSVALSETAPAKAMFSVQLLERL